MIVNVPLDRIKPNPWQTRHADPDPEYIAELAADIAAHGLLQLPMGRVVDAKSQTLDPHVIAIASPDLLEERNLFIQLAFGHNRLAAYQHLANNQPLPVAGEDAKAQQLFPDDRFSSMPVTICALTDQDMATMSWAENEKRQDHTAIDRALAIQQRITDFDWTHKEVAQALGLSRSAISNALRLLDLPDPIKTRVQAGEISGRQATAILPLYKLPQEILESARLNWMERLHPESIEALAMSGASSDEVRERINQMVETTAIDLRESAFPAEAKIPADDIHDPVCDNCPIRIQRSGAWLCPDRKCYRSKKAAWKKSYLESASAETGIPILSKDDNVITHFYQRKNEAPLILEAGCENLRLVYDRTNEGYLHVTLEDFGHPHVEFVCSKRPGACTCLKAAQLGFAIDQIEEVEKAELEAEEKKKRNRKRLREVRTAAGKAFLDALDENHTGAWALLAGAVYYSLKNDAIAKGWSVDTIQKKIAAQIVPDPYNPDNDPSTLLEAINKKYTQAGLDPITPPRADQEAPGDEKSADKVPHILKRWNRISGWIQTLRTDPPTIEAVAGNLDNLEKLDREAGEIPEDDKAPLDPLYEDGALINAISMLDEILFILSTADGRDHQDHIWNWSKDGFEHVSWLVTFPPSDVNFRSQLKAAPVHVVAYALALVGWKPQQKTRIKAITARLDKLEKEIVEAAEIPAN